MSMPWLVGVAGLVVVVSAVPCPLGRYRSQVSVGTQRSHIFCQTCARGRFVALVPLNDVEPSDGRGACLITCPAGQYIAARRACAMCPAGKFRPQGAAPACWSCAAGTFGRSAGAKSVVDCRLCPAGRIAATIAAQRCVSCAVTIKRGYQYATGQTRCNVEKGGHVGSAKPPPVPSKAAVSEGAARTVKSCGPGRFLARTELWRQGPSVSRTIRTPSSCDRCPEGRLGRWPASARTECSGLPQAEIETAQARSAACPAGSLPQRATKTTGAGCVACPPGQHWRAGATGGARGDSWAEGVKLARIGALAGAAAIAAQNSADQAAQKAAAAVAEAGGNDAQIVLAAGESAFAGTLTTLGEFHHQEAAKARDAARERALQAYAWYIAPRDSINAIATAAAWIPPGRASDTRRSCVPCPVGQFAPTPGRVPFMDTCQPCDALWPGAGTGGKRGAAACTHGSGLSFVKKREAEERVQRAATREAALGLHASQWHRWAVSQCPLLRVEATREAHCDGGPANGVLGIYSLLHTSTFAFRLMGVQPCAARGAPRRTGPVILRRDGGAWRIGTVQQILLSTQCAGSCTESAPPRSASWDSPGVQPMMLKIRCVLHVSEDGGEKHHSTRWGTDRAQTRAGGNKAATTSAKPTGAQHKRLMRQDYSTVAPSIALPTLPPAFFSSSLAQDVQQGTLANMGTDAGAEEQARLPSGQTHRIAWRKSAGGAACLVLAVGVCWQITRGRTTPRAAPPALFETQMLLNRQEGISLLIPGGASDTDEVLGPQFRFDPSQFKAL